MDTYNWRPTQGESVNGGDRSMESDDWRTQLQPDSRQRIVNKIMDTLKRHLPFSGQEGLQELKKIAVRFEEKIYTAAISQADYLQKISTKMLTMETKSQNGMANSMPSNSAGSQGVQQVNSQGQPLPIPMCSNHPQPGKQVLSQSMHHSIASTGMQGSGSSGLSSEMDTSNWRPTQGDSAGGGDPSLESDDWRTQLQQDSRQRIVNKIMDTLKRHHSFSGQEGLQELKQIAVGFEENIYTTATSQSDYLRKISLKMLNAETEFLNATTNSAGNSIDLSVLRI